MAYRDDGPAPSHRFYGWVAGWRLSTPESIPITPKRRKSEFKT